ncbi:MAG TPA: type II secretion system protein [Pirellulales bacterium]|nr:type II secretion system protein [Pirellulales bacterium]
MMPGQMTCCCSSRRRGLTLLELVVVMAILAGLAAILIPLFPNLLSQSHSSAAATNVAEVTKAVQMYYSQNALYPNNLDSLTSGAALFTSLPMVTSGAMAQLNQDLVVTAAPSATDVSALNSAGLTTVLNMQQTATSGVTNSVWSPTFYPYGDGTNGLVVAPTPTTISISTPLVQLSAAAAQRLGLESNGVTTNTYYVFGLGDYSSMQGTAMDQAPVHWMANMTMNGATMSMSPSTVYSRFGLIFQTASAGTALSTAKFVGTVLLTGAGVANGTKPMSTYLGTQQ